MPQICIIRRLAAFCFRIGFSAILAFAAGCSYKSEIRQGDDKLPEKLSSLQTGMTREEVRELLGDSRIPAVFADGEIIYYYRRRAPGFFPKIQTWGVALTFDGETLADIRVLPGADDIGAAEE